MKILVTGSDGYIGARLGPALAARGHEVAGVDTGFYLEGLLYGDPGEVRTIPKDVRRLEGSDLLGFDAAVHLAELSNDPLGELNPALTRRINHHGSVRFARLCRAAGISRFVYSSSCSVYGVGADDVKTEESGVSPQTAYAECKLLVERDVRALAGPDFCPTFLRNATAYGPSPRMRFDIVLNNLAGLAWTTGEIAMTSDGTPWRPLVHVDDICAAIACVLEAPREAVQGEVFNVGADEENYRVRDIAALIGAAFPGCRVVLGRNGADNRSYRVSFRKILRHVPAFACSRDARAGARELHDLFQAIGMDAGTFHAPPFTRLRQLRGLIATGHLDAELFWTHRTPKPDQRRSTRPDRATAGWPPADWGTPG